MSDPKLYTEALQMLILCSLPFNSSIFTQHARHLQLMAAPRGGTEMGGRSQKWLPLPGPPLSRR